MKTNNERNPMTNETEGVVTPSSATLRKAASEAMLAGALLLSNVQRQSATWGKASQAKQSEERFRRALEALREALS